MLLPLLIAVVVGYLLGSLPFGYLVARSKGVNIFEVGSRNPGATNVRRVLGAGPGNLVFALDALKGAIAAALPLAYFWYRHSIADTQSAGDHEGGWPSANWQTAAAVAGLISALVGHSFSCFTRFRGGKGVATSVGGLVILMPLAAVIATASWFAVFYSSRYVSLASICASFVLVATAFVLRLPWVLIVLAFVIAGFVILRHRANIVRLLNGTENKFVKKGPSSPA
jgi:acyl phosphate:glycerol-3-phosphate acyltransferase